jgi:hypothetical protein
VCINCVSGGRSRLSRRLPASCSCVSSHTFLSALRFCIFLQILLTSDPDPDRNEPGLAWKKVDIFYRSNFRKWILSHSTIVLFLSLPKSYVCYGFLDLANRAVHQSNVGVSLYVRHAYRYAYLPVQLYSHSHVLQRQKSCAN